MPHDLQKCSVSRRRRIEGAGASEQLFIAAYLADPQENQKPLLLINAHADILSKKGTYIA